MKRDSSCLYNKKKTKNHRRNNCKLCKVIYARRYRTTEKGKKDGYNRWKLIRGSRLELAKREVYKAVRSGLLPNIKGLECIDCFKLAEVYDHRDYRKPLEVWPVCKKCNYKRGPGKYAT